MPILPSWLNPFDVLFALALIGGVIYGFLRGLVRMALNLAVLYVAAVLAMTFHVWLGGRISYIAGGRLPEAVTQTIAFLLILILTTVVVNFALSKAFKETNLPGIRHLDQLGGLVIGFVLVAVWIGLILIGILFIIDTPGVGSDEFRANIAAYINQSKLVPMFNRFLPIVVATLRPWMPLGEIPAIFRLRLF